MPTHRYYRYLIGFGILAILLFLTSVSPPFTHLDLHPPTIPLPPSGIRPHHVTDHEETEYRTFSLDSAHSYLRGDEDKVSHLDHVLILTPLMDATSYIDNYFTKLSKLNYPKELISLAFLVSATAKDGQQDPTVLALESHVSSLMDKHLYRRITLIRQTSKSFNYTHEARHEYEVQTPRRKELAYCRNALLSSAMMDESWVLWLDVDVIEYSPNMLVELMKLDKDVVVPNCFRTETGWSSSKSVPYDRNNWLETTESLASQRVMEKDEILFEGYGRYQPTYRQSMADLDPNVRKLVPLDGVGGTFTLVKAIVHRSGVNFPIHPVDHQIETEGFAKWAKLLGFSVYGAPYLVVYHA